jgi:hypothetical protein
MPSEERIALDLDAQQRILPVFPLRRMPFGERINLDLDAQQRILMQRHHLLNAQQYLLCRKGTFLLCIDK